MKVVNLGSLNLDRVYRVEHFVKGQETISAKDYSENAGGKGLNQSIALARAGMQVLHIGSVGKDGEILRALLAQNGVDTHLVNVVEGASGHAVIQLVEGQNCILVYGGANQMIGSDQVRQALTECEGEDVLLLQNETSSVPEAICMAKEKGMRVAFNASPVTPDMSAYPMDLVDLFFVNEGEGMFLAGTDCSDPERILDSLRKKYNAKIVLTLGGDGAYYQDHDMRLYQPAFSVPVVDTTGAGDTFTGYFLANLHRGPEKALRIATAAAALAVGTKGAAPGIPTANQVKDFLIKQ
ncbi:ribokinase [uncultured Ruthenibacterium sp.]|uniref:ribokinase n=1 Tax=uncultured Ruthenibacterium sp. TaxID=1905347 RepID=UPI00349EFCE1